MEGSKSSVKRKNKKKSKQQLRKERKKRKRRGRKSSTCSYAKRLPSLFDEIRFPKSPVNPYSLEQFKHQFQLKMQLTDCAEYLLDDETLRRSKPSKSDSMKKYRKWKEDVKWIGVALKTCLINHQEGYTLIKNEMNGVTAWNILMNRYDRRKFNEGSASAVDLQSLLEVTLDSVKNGSFNKFISKLF